MAPKLTWSPQARTDLIDIYLTIGIEQPAAAERYFAMMEQKARLLVAQPCRGVRKPEIHPAARILIESPYVLLYEIEPDTDEGEIDTMATVRVVDGRRDLRHLLPV